MVVRNGERRSRSGQPTGSLLQSQGQFPTALEVDLYYIVRKPLLHQEAICGTHHLNEQRVTPTINIKQNRTSSSWISSNNYFSERRWNGCFTRLPADGRHCSDMNTNRTAGGEVLLMDSSLKCYESEGGQRVPDPQIPCDTTLRARESRRRLLANQLGPGRVHSAINSGNVYIDTRSTWFSLSSSWTECSRLDTGRISFFPSIQWTRIKGEWLFWFRGASPTRNC